MKIAHIVAFTYKFIYARLFQLQEELGKEQVESKFSMAEK
jgi:hypothetical protein